MLQEFLESTERLQDDVSDELIDLIEEENGIVSDKILQSKFAYMVLKHNRYDKINDGFEVYNERLKNEIIRIKQLENKIVAFKPNTDLIIGKCMRELLSNIIDIDETRPVLSKDIHEEFKEGYVTTDSLLTFAMKGNSVYSIDLLTKQMNEIEKLREVYQAKLLPLSNQSLLVVGGQSTDKRAQGVTKVKKTVTELYWNDFTSQWRIK